jgi:hypothetical protein
MGAALTYARRYAHFTLVGIAGEDDLDAPDLNAPTAPVPTSERSAPKKIGSQLQADRGAKAVSGHTKPMLDAERSGALRDRLAAELSQIYSTEEAGAFRSLRGTAEARPASAARPNGLVG